MTTTELLDEIRQLPAGTVIWVDTQMGPETSGLAYRTPDNDEGPLGPEMGKDEAIDLLHWLAAQLGTQVLPDHCIIS